MDALHQLLETARSMEPRLQRMQEGGDIVVGGLRVLAAEVYLHVQ